MERFNFFNHYLPAESAPSFPGSLTCLRASHRQVRLRDRTRNFKTASERSLAHSEIR